ncbi:DUF2225 domain-containing protein [Peribacillus sp. NPDC101481]|uniref:DUF2225 domain-containing protein n=1 Tax=unclassified Peribacillus TaxID=2675266 RepID=UPI0037FFA74B
MEIIMEKVSSQWVPHHFSNERSIKDAINTYKLASYCGALKKENHIILAGICLRIAWLYRINKNKEQEERFLRFALRNMKHILFNRRLQRHPGIRSQNPISRWRHLKEDRK